MKRYKQEALDILKQFPNSETAESLAELVEYVIDRKK
jgi:geranylgeranyl pyrophosphate synthase